MTRTGPRPSSDSKPALLSVIRRAVYLLGKLALRGPRSYLSANERDELNTALFECLEELNDEAYGGD